MDNKFTTSINIIRDINKDFRYIPTPNATRIVNQLTNDFKKGLRSFTIIGSYGTGKSSFLWAIEQTLLQNKKFFDINFLSNPKIDFIKIVGEYQSLRNSFINYFDSKTNKNTDSVIFSEIFNRYHDLGKKNKILFLVIDEFGKYLEYATQNSPEKELYFFQQLAEFVNNPEYNIVLITTVHQNFDAYAIGLSKTQKQEWDKVKGRFKEITFNEPVDQLLFLAAEHSGKKQLSNEIKNDITKCVELLIKSKSYNVNINYVNEIAKKLFHLDVISAYTLTLALQRYAQNERSLFSFLESTDHTGILQHAVAGKRFYTIADVYNYLIFNYYSFLNSRYNPDFYAWKSIKASLEKAEALFESDILSYEKIIKTIGLLSLFANSGAILNKQFIIKYSSLVLEIKSPDKFIEELERRKIIVYRNYSNRYVLFEGSDLDIQTALIEAGNSVDEVTDIVTILNQYYPLLPIMAKRTMYDTGTPRLFEYKVSSDPVTLTPKGEIDGYINLIFNERNIIDQIIHVSADNPEAILYCYYNNSKAIKDLLFEMEKTKRVIDQNLDDKPAIIELKNILLHQRNLLTHRILNSFYNGREEVVWVFNGEIQRIENQKNFNQTLSQICEQVYNQSPIFNNELVNKHKISPSIHTAKRNYFKALVNDWDKPMLGLPIDKYPPEKTIYLSLLANNGINLLSDEISEEIRPSDKNRFNFIWDVSVEFLNSAKTSRRNLSELVDKLSVQPYKLKQGLLEFWIPTFIFIKRNEFALFHEDVYLPNINEETLDLIAKRPHEYEVKAFVLDGVKLDIFNSYRIFLSQETKQHLSTSNFIETIKPFLTFYRNLPEYSKNTARLSKPARAIKNAIANSKDPEKSFFEDFPAALGFSINQLENSKEKLLVYTKLLQESIKEVRNAYDELVGRVELFIQSDIVGDEIPFEEYKEELQKRFRSLRQHLLLPAQRAFIQRLNSAIEDKNAWLNSLAQALIGVSLEKIKDADEILFYDRFKQMVLELDSLNVLSKTDFIEGKENVFDLQINSFAEGYYKKVVRLPKNKNKQLVNLQEELKEKLSNDNSLNIAALTSLLKDLL